MRSQILTRAELHIEDRVLYRILAAWGKWWIAKALLQLALHRRLWADLGNHLRIVKARRDALPP